MCEAATKNSHTWVLLSALTFAELAGRTDAWQRGLKEFNVTKSMFLEGFRQEGRVEGRVEGEVKGLRSAVVLALEGRFGEPIPANVIASVNSLEDVNRLKALVKKAPAAVSLEAFQSAIAVDV